MSSTTSDPARLAVRLGSGDGGVVVSTRLRVVPVGLALAALHVALSWWRLSRSWYWQDDLNLLAKAADRGLGGLLFSDYNGHLVPGSWLVAWLVDRISPLSWTLGAGFVLLVVVATDLALLAALVRMFGDRPAILVPYALFCSTSLTLTAVVWWAAAMQWMPTCLAFALALYFHTGYVANRDPRDFAGSLLAVAFGLFFFEKALTIPVVLALMTVLYLVPGPLRVRPWRGFRRYVAYWLAHAALAGGYLALYLSRAEVTTGDPGKPGDGLALTRNMLLHNYIPSLFGGPLEWTSTPGGSLASWPDAPGWLEWPSYLLAAAVVIGSILLVRGGWRAWVLLGAFLTFSVVLVARTRLGFVGPFIGRDHRYLTDAAVLGPVCIALGWIPLRPGLDKVVPDPDALPAFRVRQREQLLRGGRRWADAHRPRMLLAGVLSIALVTLLGAFSGDRFMRSWETNPGAEYFANLRGGLDAAQPKPAFMFDQELPTSIMTATFGKDRMLAKVAPAMGVAPRFGTWSQQFYVADATGHLRRGAVEGPSAASSAFAPACSRAKAPKTGVTLVVPNAPPLWVWKVQLAYLANKDTPAQVSYGDGPKVRVRLSKGLNTVFVAVEGGGPGVSVTGLGKGAVVCLGTVTVGNPVVAK